MWSSTTQHSSHITYEHLRYAISYCYCNAWIKIQSRLSLSRVGARVRFHATNLFVCLAVCFLSFVSRNWIGYQVICDLYTLYVYIEKDRHQRMHSDAVQMSRLCANICINIFTFWYVFLLVKDVCEFLQANW